MPRAFQLVGDGTGDGLRSVISTVSFLVQTSLLPCPGPLGTPPGEMMQQTVLLVCSVSLFFTDRIWVLFMIVSMLDALADCRGHVTPCDQ